MRAAMNLAFSALLLVGPSALAQERLTFSPSDLKVGQGFTVRLPTDVPDSAYEWKVKVTVQDGEVEKDVTSQVAPGPFPNARELNLSTALAHARYAFTLTRTSGEQTSSFLLLLQFAATRGSEVTEGPPPGAGGPPLGASPAPGAGVPPGTAATAPELELKRMGERLEAVKKWAATTALLPKSESLVVSVDFFQLRLAKRRDGKDGIMEFAQRPILDAGELHRSMYAAANGTPAAASSDQVIDAWRIEKQEFLRNLVERNANTTLVVEMWREFTDDWEQEVLRQNKERFREALLQAPLIVVGILLEFEKRHIEAAMTGVRPRTLPPTGTTTGIITYDYGYGYGHGRGHGYSHAAVHHARVMSRIMHHHERRMRRIGRW
jgi:hypothetical protein